MKLVHLIGFIIKKFVTMYGHVNVKFAGIIFSRGKPEMNSAKRLRLPTAHSLRVRSTKKA